MHGVAVDAVDECLLRTPTAEAMTATRRPGQQLLLAHLKCEQSHDGCRPTDHNCG